MSRGGFVAWLYVMAIASVVIAFAERSLGWFGGGVVLLLVATYARKQLHKEAETERAGASFGFVAWAILLMLLAMAFLFWLQFKA